MNTRYLFILYMLCIIVYSSYAEIKAKSDAESVSLSSDSETDPPRSKKYRRSREPGAIGTFVSTRSVTIKTMSYEQLEARIPELIAEDNLRIAGKYLKRMLTLCTDDDIKADISMHIGDLLYKRGKYLKAVKIFSAFSLAYPGNKKHAETAAWRSIESAVKCLNAPDRCQMVTHNTVLLADSYLARTVFTAHKEEVEKIRAQCYELLVQSEMGIWSDCLAYNNPQGANAHLAYVETELTALYPPATLLAQAYKQERAPEMREPAADSLIVVERKKPTSHMADRF
jgi:hypothetical protein